MHPCHNGKDIQEGRGQRDGERALVRPQGPAQDEWRCGKTNNYQDVGGFEHVHHRGCCLQQLGEGLAGGGCQPATPSSATLSYAWRMLLHQLHIAVMVSDREWDLF